MGIWGEGLYDDLALDVKSIYLECLYNGLIESETEDFIFEKFKSEIQNQTLTIVHSFACHGGCYLV